MAAVWHSVQPVTSGAGDRGIYLKKLSLAVNCAAEMHEIFWSLFAQVRFMLIDFWVICSQDRARRIFQSAQLWCGIHITLDFLHHTVPLISY
jgi:hypothetical protein